MKPMNHPASLVLVFFLLALMLPGKTSAQLFTLFDVEDGQSLSIKKPLISQKRVQRLRGSDVKLYYIGKRNGNNYYSSIFGTGKFELNNPSALWMKAGYTAYIYSDMACKNEIRVFRTPGIRDLERTGLKEQAKCLILVKKR